MHLSISNVFVASKIYDKRDDFDLDIVNFPFLDGDVPRSTSYRVYISQLIRFARVSFASRPIGTGGKKKKLYRADFSDQFKNVSYVTNVLDIT